MYQSNQWQIIIICEIIVLIKHTPVVRLKNAMRKEEKNEK